VTVSERHFQAADVERLIPRLTEVMTRVMRAHADAEAGRERLAAERARITAAGGGVVDQAAWRATESRARAMLEIVQGGLNEIAAMGGAPKDLALGLVDFPHVRDGREVNLCWKHGERAVRWWHGLDEGYGSRKPL
jgi:hypothetical protein